MIVNKENVTKRGEVFTNKREVNDMFDAVSDENKEIIYNWKVLDPAVGYGAFIDEAVNRKIKWLERNKPTEMADFTQTSALIWEVLSTSFAVDINEYSIEIARRILLERIATYFINKFGKFEFNQYKFYSDVLKNNVIVGDYLTGLDPQGNQIWFLDKREPAKKTRKPKIKPVEAIAETLEIDKVTDGE